jgi:hypothetical protein
MMPMNLMTTPCARQYVLFWLSGVVKVQTTLDIIVGEVTTLQNPLLMCTFLKDLAMHTNFDYTGN